jgi:hypothetical protein
MYPVPVVLRSENDFKLVLHELRLRDAPEHRDGYVRHIMMLCQCGSVIVTEIEI